ncbi:hypothetical protein, partial [Pseudomonas syringae group genomosp. 7]|uniref:hypothetical protein n=1 Tax=Pseudomonas syringae group genomosp. 7 TaxID=251699 RepID=UPI00376F9FE9
VVVQCVLDYSAVHQRLNHRPLRRNTGKHQSHQPHRNQHHQLMPTHPDHHVDTVRRDQKFTQGVAIYQKFIFASDGKKVQHKDPHQA